MSRPMKSAKALTFTISGAVLLSLLGFAASRWLLDNNEITVAVAAVKLSSRPLVIRLSGALEPVVEVDVTSRLAGRLTEVRFKPGDLVNAGAVVATVSSAALRERAQVAEADLKAASKELQEREQQAAAADQQLARQRELYRRDLIARRDVEEAESHAATARAQLDLVQAQIAQAGAMLSQARKVQQLAPVLAPVSGVVTGGLSVGALVNEARAILAIAQIDRLKFTDEVAAEFADLIGDGMTVQVVPRAAPAIARQGILSRINGKAVASEFVPVGITVNNRDHGWQIGMVVDASLPLNRQVSVMTITRAALHGQADKYHVHVIANGRALQRSVEVGEVAGEIAVIRKGLKPGDLVIVNAAGELADGLRVRAAAGAQR